MKEIKNRRKWSKKLGEINFTQEHNSEVESYPYLALLGEICSIIEKTNTSSVKEEDTFSHEEVDFQNCFQHTNCVVPYLDTNLYPYSSLLQKLMDEANLQEIDLNRSNCKKINSLNSVMCSLPYPPDGPSCSQLDNASVNLFDMSYASKLKHIGLACQSEMSEKQDQIFSFRGDSSLKEIRFLLARMFPSFGGTENLIYSEKLKYISSLVRMQEKFDCDSSFSPVSWEGYSCDNVNHETDSQSTTNHKNVSDQPYSSNLNGDCSNPTSLIHVNVRNIYGPISPQYKNTREPLSNISAITSEGASKSMGQNLLFEALMKNVQAQSASNHIHNYETVLKEERNDEGVEEEEEGALLIQEPLRNEFDPQLLGETGMKIIERRLTKHLKDLFEAR